MVLAHESFITFLKLIDENGNPATGKTVTYTIYDEAQGVFGTGSMDEIAGTAIYYKAWTPDADGYWVFHASYSGADFKFYDLKGYQIGKGVEDEIYERLGAPAFTTIAGDIANLITRAKGLNANYDNIGNFAGQTSLTSLLVALGIPDVAGKSLYTCIITDRLDSATYGLNALKLLIDAVNADLGDFSSQTSLQSLLAALGIPDVAGKPLYTCLITDRLDNTTYGLSALHTDIEALENKIKASPSVDSIFFKAGGAVCPVAKSIWDALGDGTVSLNDISNDIGTADGKLDTIITRMGDPTGDTLASFAAKWGDISENLATILETFVASESGGLGDRIAFIQQFIGKGTGTVLPANKSLYDVIALDRLDNVTYGLNALKTLIDAIQADIGDFSSYANFASLLEALGIPDVAGKSLYTCLITDRLDNGTYGLSALNDDLDTLLGRLTALRASYLDELDFDLDARLGAPAGASISADILALYNLLTNGTYGLAALDTDLGTLLSRLTAARAGYLDELDFDLDARLGTPSGASISVDILALENKLKASPSVDSILFKSGGAVCPAGKSIWDALGDGTVSLNTLSDYVDSLEAWLGNPSGDTLSTITAKLGDNQIAIGTVTDRLYELVQTSSTLTGTPTVNFMDTNLTEATDDHYNGSVIVFADGNLAGQASIISDYNGTTKEITVNPAFPEAPSSGDAFIILSIPLGGLFTGAKGLEQTYDAIDQLFNLNRIGDTLTTDGTEQVLFIQDNPDFAFEPYKLLIDTTNQGAGTTTVIRQYLRLKEGGAYVEFIETTLADAQDPLGVKVDLYPNTYGIKVTIEKTGGDNEAYDYEVYMKEK